MVKELGEEFEGQFVCLGENTKKHIIFFAKIKKENENGKTITYKKNHWKYKVYHVRLIIFFKNSTKANAKTEIWPWVCDS